MSWHRPSGKTADHDEEGSATATTAAHPSAHERLDLVVLGPDQFVARVPLVPGTTLCLGRGKSADVDLRDAAASRQHARLHVAPGPVFHLEDLGSANGTRVRSSRLDAGTPA